MSFVNRGKIRRKVLENLSRPMTPTELSHKIQTHRSTTSRTLIDLEKKGLVHCLTPNERMSRYYEITALGQKIILKILEGI